MVDQVPGPELQNRVALFLGAKEPSNWTCRECITRALDVVTLREVKIGLLRLAQSHGKDYIETACAVCTDCGAETAVVRLGRRRHLRQVA